MENANFEIGSKILKDFQFNELEDIEDEGNYHIFQKKIKDLKQKIKLLNFMMSNLKPEERDFFQKKTYLEQLAENFQQILDNLNNN